MRQTLTEANVDTLRRVARIIPGGASEHAITEYDRRTVAGEDIRIYEVRSPDGSSLIVGPPIANEVSRCPTL